MRNPVSHFAYSKSDIDIKRSTFDRSQDHLTTMSAGLLYPLLVDEVYPGDTYSLDVSSLVRMSTPIHPVMGNAFLDLYFFFVPNRIVWEHWKDFMGESPEDPYINPIEYSVPQLISSSEFDTEVEGQYFAGPVPPKSLLDYLGVPAGSVPKSINALPIRAFCKIWNEWFRDQNLQNAIDVPTNDANVSYSCLDPNNPGEVTLGSYWNNNEEGSDAYINNTSRGGDLPPVNKYHDYFTSALKNPQKGNPVPIPLSGYAPVVANDLVSNIVTNYYSNSSGEVDLPITKVVDSWGDPVNAGTLSTFNGNLYNSAATGAVEDFSHFGNLAGDLSNVQGIYSTISDLRYAFQLQKFLEADSRGGTRYREIIKQHFGVTSPDATQQIPEFLGGKRISINMSQVLQTSSTDSTSPQGNTAAYSLTSDTMSAFTKSFTEHGWLFAVGCIRTEHSYQQGLEKMFSRKNKFDYYFPEFANISEQPIYNKEIYTPRGPVITDTEWNKGDEIFGYQEAWADLRYKPNRISGEFRSSYEQSLDVWHYGDDYSSMPYLSSAWIRETRNNIDRTLAVNSELADQFICDFYFKMKTTRVLPTYSIPGFADHH